MFKKSSLAFTNFFDTTFLNTGTIWLSLMLALGLFTRAYFLSQPMRGDGSYTFLTYINAPITALFEYSEPNNHVLNTLLIKFSTWLFQPSPASIRFPAFAAGLAAIALVFFLARSLQKTPNAGIFAAALSAIFPYLILYSTNARGYTLVVALTLLVAWLGQRFSERPSESGAFWLAVFSALGMFSIPIMVLPLAGIFFWLLALLLLKRTPLQVVLRQFVLPFGLWTALLTALLYAPVVYFSGGLAPIISNKFVEPQSWNEFFSQIFPQLATSFQELNRDVPPALLLTLLLLVVLGLIGSIKDRNWGLFLFLPAFLLGAAVVLLLQHTTPFTRTWIYLIPVFLLLADAGLVFLLDHLPSWLPKWVNVIVLTCTLFFALNLTSRNVITTYTDTSGFVEAPIAVTYLKPIFKPGDELRVSSTADWSVYFYFWYHGMSSALYDSSSPRTNRIFFIHKKSRGPLTAEALQKFTLLFETGNMDLYEGKR